MISRLPALALLLSAALTLLACGPTATPTPTVGPAPAATEVATPAATEAPVAEGDGGDEVKDAVQQFSILGTGRSGTMTLRFSIRF